MIPWSKINEHYWRRIDARNTATLPSRNESLAGLLITGVLMAGTAGVLAHNFWLWETGLRLEAEIIDVGTRSKYGFGSTIRYTVDAETHEVAYWQTSPDPLPNGDKVRLLVSRTDSHLWYKDSASHLFGFFCYLFFVSLVAFVMSAGLWARARDAKHTAIGNAPDASP